MRTPADDVFLLLIVAHPVWEYFVSWPRDKARLASGQPDARWKLYRNAIATQWVATAAVVTLWFVLGRPAAVLYLQVPTGWRLVLSIVFVVGIALPMGAQVVAVLRVSAKERVALRPKLGYARSIVPHTATEFRWFLPLAITAGLCEELIYRGYLTWLLASYVGLWVGAVLSVAIFGLAHGYLGKTGVVRATLLGAIFAGFAIALQSLYAGMLVHAAVDLGSGMLGYVLLREPVETPS